MRFIEPICMALCVLYSEFNKSVYCPGENFNSTLVPRWNFHQNTIAALRLVPILTSWFVCTHWIDKPWKDFGAIELQKWKVSKISAGPPKVGYLDLSSLCTYSFWPQLLRDSLDLVLCGVDSEIFAKNFEKSGTIFWFQN